MPATQTIGELLVKLLFQTNADRALGGTSKLATEAEQNIRQLVDASDSFSISMRGGEPVIEVQNKRIGEQARITDSATKSWRSYLNEQRFQSRIARETMGAVTSIAYAMSFLYDYALIVLLREGYGVDFVRHRCRQVARELANLLPMLEPDPETPASVRRPDPA